MIIAIANVLTEDATVRLRDQLNYVDFQDGRATAGWHARTVKNNTQANPHDTQVGPLKNEVRNALAHDQLFQLAARPARMMPVMFSRYLPDMAYGAHVDDGLMQGPEGTVRTDIAFTLFLTPPEDYDGGELVMRAPAGEQVFKLAAGAMVLYPASTLHRVEKITRGERLAAVGWVQSYVRDPAQREILFDLGTVHRQLFDQQGKTAHFDAISKSLANLLRMWAEP